MKVYLSFQEEWANLNCYFFWSNFLCMYKYLPLESKNLELNLRTNSIKKRTVDFRTQVCKILFKWRISKVDAKRLVLFVIVDLSALASFHTFFITDFNLNCCDFSTHFSQKKIISVLLTCNILHLNFFSSLSIISNFVYLKMRACILWKRKKKIAYTVEKKFNKIYILVRLIIV